MEKEKEKDVVGKRDGCFVDSHFTHIRRSAKEKTKKYGCFFYMDGVMVVWMLIVGDMLIVGEEEQVAFAKEKKRIKVSLMVAIYWWMRVKKKKQNEMGKEWAAATKGKIKVRVSLSIGN